MRSLFIVLFVMVFKVLSATEYVQIPELGTKAPAFKTFTNRGKVEFPKSYEGKWVIFFSLCNAFTKVCTSEMNAFLQDQAFFKEKNCELVGLTFNTVFDQGRWLNQIKRDLSTKIDITLIPDVEKSIAKLYGMYQPAMSQDKAMRAVIIIDPNSKIRSVLIYPVFNGRNIKEIERLLTALQISDKEEKATPANWKEGDAVVTCSKCTPPKTDKKEPKTEK